ncbi:uncharacterized protein LOC108163395 [Drosophila miranda]|uniref:uncharacterized protein LOC108163395 n=1 Tax=Drosophila miranda TaxID=7229 RepID=UPI0007E7605A|nr:uncharacterized protein LOC108163395 [Drosophila miranda]
MGPFWAVATAALLYAVRLQFENSCSPAPQLGSFIFLLAAMLLAWDINMYIKDGVHLSCLAQYFVGTFASLVILEFFNLKLWCWLEAWLCQAAQHLCLNWGLLSVETYLENEYWIIGAVTTAVATFILWFFGMLTLPHFSPRDLEKVTITNEFQQWVNNPRKRRYPFRPR